MNPITEYNANITRRHFFGRSSVGIGAAALGSLMEKGASAAPTTQQGVPGLEGLPHWAPKARRVIYLFQNGAPTHVDLYDYKPKLKEMHGKQIPDAIAAGQTIQHHDRRPKGKALPVSHHRIQKTRPERCDRQ